MPSAQEKKPPAGGRRQASSSKYLFGGAKGSRTPDLLNAILKTANSLSFLIFPDVSEMGLQWALLDVCCFRRFP